MNKIKELNYEWFLFSFTLFVSTIPILPYAFRSILTIIFLLCAVLFYVFKRRPEFQYSYKEKRLFVISFFPLLIPLLSLVFSKDLNTGLKDIVQMSSLGAFPLIFFLWNQQISKNIFILIKWVFVGSVLLLVMYQMLNSILNLNYLMAPVSLEEIKVNGYQSISDVLPKDLDKIKIRRFRKFNSEMVDTHPTYQGLWIILSLFFLFQNCEGRKVNLKRMVLVVPVFLILSLWLFLIATRMPIIAGVIAMFVITVINFKSIKKKLIIIFVLAAVSIFGFFSTNMLKNRINEVFITGLNKLDSKNRAKDFNSVNVRNGIYYCAIELIKENPFLGVGIGDLQKELSTCLITKVNSKVYSWNDYNTHNQYLFYASSSGVFGFLIFTYFSFCCFKFALNRKDLTYLFFLIVIHIAFLSENILARNDGVLFFSFFNSLFLFGLKKEKTNKRKILITGARRSGTTFIGKLLSSSYSGLSYVEEPFNPVRGIKAIDHVWYPYINVNSKSLLKNLEDVFKLKKIRFKNGIINNETKTSNLDASNYEVFLEIFKNNSKESILTRLGRVFFKSNHYLSYEKARLSTNNTVVFKDALLSLSINQISNLKEVGIVVIFRNPLGFFHSMERLNWAILPSNFLNQEELMVDFPFIKELPKNNKVDQIINEWVIINTIILKSIKVNKNIICVSHDKLSKKPLDQLSKICERLNLNENINLEQVDTITNSSSEKRTDKTKNVKRDSIQELNSWKGKIDSKTVDYIKLRTDDLYNELNLYAI